jgi:predicted nucleic acid-binding protein
VNYFWLDANAIVKQYVTEKRGTPLINHLFTRISLNRIFCLFDSMDETLHVFVKKRNGEEITITTFNQVIQRFEAEFIYHADVEKVDATRNQKIAARQFIETYSINSTDAYILQCALDEADKLRTVGDDLILVSSDKRLLAAARQERLLTFDPENDTQTDIDVLINS